MVPSILLATSLLVLNANSEMMFLIRTKIQFTFCWTRFLNFADLFKLMYLYFWHLYMGRDVVDINSSKKRHHEGIPGAPTVIDGSPPPVIPLSLFHLFQWARNIRKRDSRGPDGEFAVSSSVQVGDMTGTTSSPVNKPGTHGHACRGAAWQPRAAGVTHRTSSNLPHVVNVQSKQTFYVRLMKHSILQRAVRRVQLINHSFHIQFHSQDFFPSQLNCLF